MHPLERLLTPLGRALRKRRPDPAKALANAPELSGPETVTVTSPAFTEGREIPAKHCGPLIGPQISPELAWSGLPEGTRQVLFILDDIDVPGAVPVNHTVALLGPDTAGVAEGGLKKGADGVRFVPGRLGATGYIGPRPLPGHGTHRYRFHVLALDKVLDGAAPAHAHTLPAAVDGHVIARGTLMGTRTC